MQCTWNVWLQGLTCIGASVRIGGRRGAPCGLNGNGGNPGRGRRGERVRAKRRHDALERVRGDGPAGREANVGQLGGAARARDGDELQRAFDELPALFEPSRARLEIVGDAIDDALRIGVAS